MNNKRWADWFYSSSAWRKCRDELIKKRGGLCEKCLQKGLITAGVEAHHIIPITRENILNPAITLNHDNLMLLCSECHKRIKSDIDTRTREDGHVDLPLMCEQEIKNSTGQK